MQTVFRRSDDEGRAAGAVLALTVHPFHSGEGGPLHFLVVFAERVEEANRRVDGLADIEAADRSALQRLEDENRSLKRHLQETLDRSAVSNEELKASNEELQAINEELRSAKEELETSKEELQSVNEELTTVNFELRMTHVTADGDTARLIVADTGIGIAPRDLPRVFDLFDQGGNHPAGARRTGLGIGLALVRELAQAHGGNALAASPGKGLGATFTVEIGLSARPPVGPDKPPEAPLNRRILLVDDSADNFFLFAELLRMEGAQVETPTSAIEALEMLSRGGHDLLLSDIGMPDMSGLELIRQARALHLAPGFRSIAISSYGSDADKSEALAAGFDGHLSKPVSIERLRALLDKLGR